MAQNNKFNFPIFPDRLYTLTYDGYDYKVSGEAIIQAFRRDAFLEKFIEEVDNEDDTE